jgi:hypothetical protein
MLSRGEYRSRFKQCIKMKGVLSILSALPELEEGIDISISFKKLDFQERSLLSPP